MSDMLEGIHAVLAATPLRWAQLIETIPDDLLQRRPVASSWSMTECLQHMIATEQLFAARLEALRHEQDIPAADPTKFEGAVAEVPAARMLLAQFASLREASLWQVRQITEDMMDRSGRHSEFGMVTVGQLLHEWAAHDLDHTMQAERVLMQPFIHGCGPWKPFFAPHIILEEAP